MSNFILSTTTLLQREIIRFLRQKNRIIGALGTPLVFWFLIGSGLNQNFKIPAAQGMPSDISYLQYFFPGTILLIILFTAIFSTISIIEDRREGFLQGVLTSPISTASIVSGNLLGGTLLASIQGLLFLVLSPLLGFSLTFLNILYIAAILFTISFGLTGLGFILAWKLDSTAGFHAIMNLFLMPMWLVSGAFFPIQGAPAWLAVVMKLNPLSYAISGLHLGFFGNLGSSLSSYPSKLFCLGICLIFATIMFILSVRVAGKNR